MERRL